jgi:LemA protein
MVFGLIFGGVIVGGIFLMGINIYNSLISLRRQVDRAWANIDVILKQRFDEIPQIIQVIEQYVGHESGILKTLAQARANYGQAQNVSDKIQASQEMSIAFRGILSIGEAYPELKSNQNFSQLQARVSQLESTIADRREIYNEATTNFNTRIEQIPDVFAARILNYQPMKLYEVAESDKQVPSLKMNMPKYG